MGGVLKDGGGGVASAAAAATGLFEDGEPEAGGPGAWAGGRGGGAAEEEASRLRVSTIGGVQAVNTSHAQVCGGEVGQRSRVCALGCLTAPPSSPRSCWGI